MFFFSLISYISFSLGFFFLYGQKRSVFNQGKTILQPALNETSTFGIYFFLLLSCWPTSECRILVSHLIKWCCSANGVHRTYVTKREQKLSEHSVIGSLSAGRSYLLKSRNMLRFCDSETVVAAICAHVYTNSSNHMFCSLRNTQRQFVIYSQNAYISRVHIRSEIESKTTNIMKFAICQQRTGIPAASDIRRAKSTT